MAHLHSRTCSAQHVQTVLNMYPASGESVYCGLPHIAWSMMAFAAAAESSRRAKRSASRNSEYMPQGADAET